MKVSDDVVEAVRQKGFALVEGFLEPGLLAAAQNALWDLYPRPDDYFSNPGAHPEYAKSQFAGIRYFPFPSWDLNRLAVLPDLVDAAERICQTDNLDLYKVELWAKYAGAIDYDQPLHRDFSNHTLVAPKRDNKFIQMTTFILLSDVTEKDGPTKVVPLEAGRDIPLSPRDLPAGVLADKEISITGPAGSLFIYRTDVIHRGSNFVGSARSRFTMLVDFQPRGLPWTGKMAWPDHALNPNWVETMERMSPRERTLFGFPAVGDPYWDRQTIRDVRQRYPRMDMAPYRNG